MPGRCTSAHRTTARAHVGYHLIGSGRRAFERSVAWQPDVRQRVRRLFFAWATPVYLCTVAGGTALAVAAAASYAYRWGWRGAALAFVALLVVVPASELVIQLLQRVISSLIPPRRLARIELDAVPVSARTMVIVPTLLDSVERVEELIAHLEVQALGNLDPRIHFALLSDFTDAATETQPQDAEILEAARAGIAALNAKHDDGEPAIGSSSFTGCGSGTRARACGWAGSASAARSRSSTGSCAAPPTRALPWRSATCRCCPTSGTASRSTATRACREAWRAN